MNYLSWLFCCCQGITEAFFSHIKWSESLLFIGCLMMRWGLFVWCAAAHPQEAAEYVFKTTGVRLPPPLNKFQLAGHIRGVKYLMGSWWKNEPGENTTDVSLLRLIKKASNVKFWRSSVLSVCEVCLVWKNLNAALIIWAAPGGRNILAG